MRSYMQLDILICGDMLLSKCRDPDTDLELDYRDWQILYRSSWFYPMIDV